MGKLIKALIQKLSAKAKAAFAENKKFFSKPATLIALGLIGIKLLNSLLEKLKKKTIPKSSINLSAIDNEDTKELLKYLKNDSIGKSVLSYASNNLDDDYLSDILIACERQDLEMINTIEDNLLNSISFETPEDLLKAIDNINDIDTKVSDDKFKVLMTKSISTAEALLSFAFLIMYIIKLTKDLITRSEHPSRYRTKYIQKLIRTTIGLIKAQAAAQIANAKAQTAISGSKVNVKSEIDATIKNITEQLNDQLKILKQIDVLLIALTLATALYIKNRQILQKRSRETLKEISDVQACNVTLPEPITDADIDALKKTTKLNIPSNMSDFNCPVDLDNTATPKEPFESKQENFTCDVFEQEQTYGDADEKYELADRAIIQNFRKKETLKSILPVDSYVDTITPVGDLSGTPVFSPVEGYIDSIETNKIVIRDIEDASDDYLNEQITSLTSHYTRLSDIKFFMNDYYIASEYPVMLSIAQTASGTTKAADKDISPRFNSSLSTYNALKKKYNKDIKDMTGESNVKKHSENETLDIIQKDIEDLQDMFYKKTRKIKSDADKTAKVIKAKSEEYTLLDYYLTLSQRLNANETTNSIQIEYRDKINDIIIKRYFVDKYKISDIEKKLNGLIKDLEKGISLGNWFDKMMKQYNNAKTDKVGQVKDWLIDIGKDNKKLDELEKIELIDRIMYLFNFYLKIKSLIGKYKLEPTSPKAETLKEGAFIDKYFKDLWKEHDNILKGINDILKILDGLSLFTVYSIVNYKEEPHRLYSIVDEPTCPMPEDMAFIPGTGYNNKRYWLKYCAFATLASVVNPVTGWATGIPPPIGPIPLPVIYIPIKPIPTKYGFIVIGLSICGMFVFPWVLLGNLASAYNTPLPDPTKIIKNEVKVLKKELTKQLSNLRKGVLKGYLDKTKKELNDLTEEIQRTKEQLKTTKSIILKEHLLTLKTKRWTLEKKYKIVFEAYSMGAKLKGSTEPLEKAEDTLNKQFDKLTALTDKIDVILAPLPITMKPNSANFGMSIKNPKPISKIGDELDQNVNTPILDKLIEPFKLKNADLMSTNYGAKLSTSVLNYKKYRNVLSAASMTIITKDAFPAYQNLKAKNIPWIAFLYKDWASTGAKQYGMPGGPPMPI